MAEKIAEKLLRSVVELRNLENLFCGPVQASARLVAYHVTGLVPPLSAKLQDVIQSNQRKI